MNKELGQKTLEKKKETKKERKKKKRKPVSKYSSKLFLATGTWNQQRIGLTLLSGSQSTVPSLGYVTRERQLRNQSC